MKKVYIYRFFVFIVALLAISKVIYVKGFLLDQAFIDSSLKLYDNQATFTLYDRYAILRATTLIIYFTLGVAFFKFSSYLNKKSQQWALLLSIPIFSIFVGALLTFYNQELSDYYAIIQTGKPIDSYHFSRFLQSTLRNSIIGFYFFSAATFFSTLEHVFLRDSMWLKRLNAFSGTFWFVSITSLFLLIEAFIYFVSNVKSANNLASSLLSIISLSVLLTVLVTLTISFLTTNSKNYKETLVNQASKISLLVISLFGTIALTESFALDMHWEVAIIIFSSGLPTYLGLLATVLIIAYLIFWLNIGNVKGRIFRNEKMESLSSQLSLLKSQINPHFLFNSLNTVYGLALEEESPKSAEGVQKLSEMMRFMLQENTADKIPLTREIKYIHDYIDFQRLRIADKENINLEIDLNEGCEGQIAPMLLIPMIENAFKHGIRMSEPSWIKVSLSCGQNEVQLSVENSMHPKTGQKSEESGIGLENVRKRLEILYPEKHLFQVFENTESFEANIKVTLS